MNLNRVDAKGGIEEWLVGEPLIRGELLCQISANMRVAHKRNNQSSGRLNPRIGFRVQGLPRKPITHNYRQLSPKLLLLWAKVVHYYGYLGFLGRV